MDKQTIDGVSRHTLRLALTGIEYLALRAEDSGTASVQLAAELRALLDKPAHVNAPYPEIHEFEGSEFVRVSDYDAIRKPAAQPQGEVEPVAYLCRNTRHPIPSLRTKWEPITVEYARSRMHNKALAEKGKADEYHLGDEFQPLYVSAEPKPWGEAVGWQFYQDGKWWNGFDTNNHRANTEAAGIPIREVYAEQPSHSGDANEMVAKVVLPERYSLAMFQMISGFESVTPEQFDLVWSACRAEAARLNGLKP